VWTARGGWSQQQGQVVVRRPGFTPQIVVKNFGGALLPSASSSASAGAASSAAANARRFFVNSLLRRVTNTQAAHLRRRAATQLSSGNPAPFFALVGISLASGSGVITKQDELDCVCAEIRRAAAKTINKSKEPAVPEAESDAAKSSWSLSDFVIGHVIDKGCSAVVHAARLTAEGFRKMGDCGPSDSEVVKNVTTDGCHVVNGSGVEDRDSVDPQPTDSSINNDVFAEDADNEFPLAIKMMFNYEAESYATAILNAMHREITPALTRGIPEELFLSPGGESERPASHLPAHPNVVETHVAFVDRVPELDKSMTLYPDALPRRINPDGLGRNMSLFLVMKKYDCNLRHHINEKQKRGDLKWKDSLILLTQLLEGITHMVRNGIAHRDLKSDNLLISEDETFPRLVISDFGCCLNGLSLPFVTWETDRGGNAALMAPEIATARPGLFTTLRYDKADVWAAGALAYEIFGAENPFYSKNLTSRNYRSVEDLPPFPTDGVPPVVGHLVREMLDPNPRRRISAEMAANICQLLLWMPSPWLSGTRYPGTQDLLQWLLTMTTKVLYESRYSNSCGAEAEYHLIATFLSRFDLGNLASCVDWINDHC